MSESAYKLRRSEVETYFDRTAADKWAALTSNSPVSRIRETVRAGRETMRTMLLDWLPADLRGVSILDAGCGTGMLAAEAARRGADVVAIDLSPSLIEIAITRSQQSNNEQAIRFFSGDMTDKRFGRFDYIVAMDSLIHYPLSNVIEILENFSERANESLLFTFAPKTPLLAIMHATGKLFPRDDRSPRIVPISERQLNAAISAADIAERFRIVRTQRISSAFYKSQAMELGTK